MKTKICSRCKTEKTVDQFYRSARGWSSWCKECHKERERRFRQTEEYRTYRDSRHVVNPKRKPKLSKIELLASETWNNVKKRCFRNGKEFDLTREFVDDLFHRFCQTHYYRLEKHDAFQPSLDRIDSARSYTQDNVRVVWLIENYARNGFSDEDVIRFCKLKLGLEEDKPGPR